MTQNVISIIIIITGIIQTAFDIPNYLEFRKVIGGHKNSGRPVVCV